MYKTKFFYPDVNNLWCFKEVESLPQTLIFYTLYLLKPNVVDLNYFKLWSLSDKINLICKDIGIRKSKFVADSAPLDYILTEFIVWNI